MTPTSQNNYQALRNYLNALLTSSPIDQSILDMPAALHSELEAFMMGKTQHQDGAGRPMMYAADLAAWATDLIYDAALTVPLPLATLDLGGIRMATQRQA